MWDFMKGKLTPSICLFWTLFDMFTFLGKKLNWLQHLLLINVAHPRRVTLFLIRLLTIIDFDLKVFLKHFNLLCAGVDLCSILRFTQRVQLLPILMFTRTATETRKRALFK